MKYTDSLVAHLRSFKQWLDMRSPYSYIVMGLLVGLIIFGVVLGVRATNFSVSDRTSIGNDAEEQAAVDTRVPSPLTGALVKRDQAEQPVIGIMISNSSDARPQSGLEDAGVVFEAVAEGGITRYLALFQEHDNDFIGPVRSLRPYFIDFARAFDASAAHVGGSKEALDNAKTELKNRDLDQFRYGTRAFDRVSFRFAPHNVYTSLAKLRTLAKENTHTYSDFTPLVREEGSADPTPNATTVSVNFSSASYNTSWSYSKESNTYQRSLGGNKHLDRETNQQLDFDSVVVIKATYGSFFRDGTTYRTVKSTGSGTAYIFQNGTAQRVTWKRPNVTSQFTFTDAESKPVALNVGQTWFAMQPSDQGLSFE